jgi:hypothetical protein
MAPELGLQLRDWSSSQSLRQAAAIFELARNPLKEVLRIKELEFLGTPKSNKHRQ